MISTGDLLARCTVVPLPSFSLLNLVPILLFSSPHSSSNGGGEVSPSDKNHRSHLWFLLVCCFSLVDVLLSFILNEPDIGLKGFLEPLFVGFIKRALFIAFSLQSTCNLLGTRTTMHNPWRIRKEFLHFTDMNYTLPMFSMLRFC